MCNLRNKPDSQVETRMITQQMAKHLKDHFPISAKYLLDEKGQIIGYFNSKVNPMDEQIIKHLK